MNNSKAAIVISQIIEKIQLVVGIIWTVFMALGFLGFMTDGKKDGVGEYILLIILVLIGMWLIIKGRRRKKMRLEFKKYVSQLSVDPTGSIENIAAATGTSVDVVKKNLKFMIKKNYFTSAYIDEKNNQLVLTVQKTQQEQYTPQASGNSSANSQTVMVTCNCKCCGGINKIAKGSVGECDFCGSPISES